MEHLPQIAENVRLPIELAIHPYVLDHRFEDRIVFPAVEAMRVVAETVKRFWPDSDVTRMTEARFDKFLTIRPAATHVAAFTDVTVHENGDITAVLLTKKKAKSTPITRIREHARVRFPRITPDLPKPPLDLRAALEGICFEISPEDVYRDLVPFGPAYHNIRDQLFISDEGAIAGTHAPSIHAGADDPGRLGSPFPLDAAFHAACVWGQRYSRFVAFPVSIDRRVIFNRTIPGKTYISRIIPVRRDPDLLVFDLWVYDDNGELFEGACGVHMRDVSAGRMRPPQWVISNGEQERPERIKRRCRALSVIEMKTLMPFAEKTLSGHERKRVLKMADKRKQSYLAARLACKRLSRALSGDDRHTAASAITTVCADLVRPCCPPTNGSSHPFCSVSHDDRFAVAAASDSRVGIDVEKISDRVLKSMHLFMSESEQALVQGSPLGEIEAALRIWSLKEAVAKALGMTLADAWNRVRVRAVGHDESRFEMDAGEPRTAVHEVVGQHVITIAYRL